MAGSSSRRWLDEHFSDQYVKRAQQEGRRSRAYFKLLELDRRDRLFQPNSVVVDLGAAPGGWTEYAVDRLGSNLADKKSLVFGLDILPMDELHGAELILGDFTENDVLQQLLNKIQAAGHSQVDLVISDMAPSLSGVSSVDQPRAMLLAELALDFADSQLKRGGSFACKVFQGEGFDPFLLATRQLFKQVNVRKPNASRNRSREVYIVGKERR